MHFSAFLSLLLALHASAAEQPAPLGKLVDLGGYRLHLYCTGKGRHTVLLSIGAGGFSFDWYLVQQPVSGFARVCSYDRADRADGAWSDPGPLPRIMRQEAHELHTALERTKERGPYILVGQSRGGLVMRVFAERYPSVSAGMVLVDATSPDTTLGFNGKLVHMRELAQARAIPEVQSMRTSPPQPMSDEERKQAIDFRRQSGERKIREPFDRLPPDIQKLELWAWSQLPRTARSEDYWPEELNELYRHTQATVHPLGDRPLISLMGMRSDRRPPDVTQERWDALNQEKFEEKRGFRNLSTNSKVVEDPMAGHSVHLDDPAAVATAIRDVLDAVQRQHRLAP